MHATVQLYGDPDMVKGLVATIAREALNSGVDIAVSARPAKSDIVTPDAEIPIENHIRKVRTYNVLKRAGLNTLQDVARYGEEALRDLTGAGDRTIDDIKETLWAAGLKLAP